MLAAFDTIAAVHRPEDAGLSREAAGAVFASAVALAAGIPQPVPGP